MYIMLYRLGSVVNLNHTSKSVIPFMWRNRSVSPRRCKGHFSEENSIIMFIKIYPDKIEPFGKSLGNLYHFVKFSRLWSGILH